MTPRERRLVLVLGVFLLFGAAFAGYALIYTPIQAAKADAEKAAEELAAKQAALAKVIKDRPRAEAAKRRSLPADPNVARAEYVEMMRKLLADAGAPSGFSITPKESLDTRNVPVFDPTAKVKKPVYTKLGFEIRMNKVGIATLTKFLQGYYRLNLLHQITNLDITRKDQEGAGGSRFKASNDRADLAVTIVSEAVILDGAENRRTLLPMPVGAVAVGGWAGYHALLNTPEASRGMSPLQLANVLATATPPREYTAITAKDFFHGPLPPPAPPKPDAEAKAPPPPPKPKEDISPYIKMTGTAFNSAGAAEATIYDQANQHLYVVTLKPKGERYEVKVEKFYYLQDKRKRIDFWPELVIQEDGTSTDRKFKVVGLDGFDLVLTESGTAPADPGKEDGGKPSKPGSKPAAKLAPPPPGAALLGGPGVALAPAPVGEKVFVWRAGQTLKSLVELPPGEAEGALRRAAPVVPPAVAGEAAPATVPVSKSN